VNWAKLGHVFPTVSTFDLQRAVESSRRCVQSVTKCRNDEGGKDATFAHSTLHGAYRKGMNEGQEGRKNGTRGVWLRWKSAALFPEFLVTIVGVENPGDATVRTFLEGEPGAAAAGIEKSVGEFRQQLGLVARTIPGH
jgi:hypothetical protein